MSNCNCHTKDNRDGSGQLGRYLKALDPAYAPIDDRSIEELLVFAKRYAAQIRFHDVPDGKDIPSEKGVKLNWKEFFRRDMAVVAASIGVIDITSMREEYEELRERLDDDPSVEKYAALYTIILGLVSRMDKWVTVALPGYPLRIDLDIAIDAFLRTEFKRIMAFEEGFKSAGFKATLKLDYNEIENDDIWGMDQAVDPDASIYTGPTPEAKLRNAALYADEIFNTFYTYIQSLIDQSDKYFTYAMEQYPAHQPHMALFIAFVKIFQLAKEQMNGLTGRMLDFYYKDVLQLTPKEPIPDKAHIIFELAKDVINHNLPVGTALKGGKDASGKELIYKTGTDIVLNQAKVKEIKTIFIDKQPPAATQPNKTIQSIFASPVANSADGHGEPFTDPVAKWPTFGRSIKQLSKNANICDAVDWAKNTLPLKNETQIGFALATPQLVLQSGNRIVALKLDALNEIFGHRKLDRANQDTITKDVAIWFSGEKEWLKVESELLGNDDGTMSDIMLRIVDAHSNGGSLGEIMPPDPCYFLYKELATIYICLPQSAPPIIGYNAKVHTGNSFDTTFPVMQVLLGPGIKISAPAFKRLKFSDMHLTVRVGSMNRPGSVTTDPTTGQPADPSDQYTPFFDGLKILTLQNDDGAVPPNKAFDPFTMIPKPGNSLYIGSPEIFNKPVNELSLNVRHGLEGADDFLDKQRLLGYDVNLLENRYWTDQHLIYTPTGYTEKQMSGNIMSYPLPRTTITYPANFENGQTEKGFLELKLTARGRKATLGVAMFDSQASGAKATITQSLMELAPYFQLKEISVSYFSDLRHLKPGIDQFFHVYPFGTVETYTTPGVENLKQSFAGHKDAAANPKASGNASIKRKKKAYASFSALDAEKEGLLVDAHELLLPQFTFEGLYDKYQKGASRSTTPQSEGEIGARDLERVAKSGALAKMVLSASGLIEQVSGGNNQYSGIIQEEGMLFIGLEKAAPLQSISMLFQFAEGSAEDEDNDPPKIHWSYLTNNEWRPLKGEDLVSDGTYGFQTTGIIKVNIPADATDNNTIITSGLHWLCASVTENSNRIPQLISIITQAVEAVFNDQGNDQAHYDNPLPAGKISKLQVAATQVSKVQQPFASYDGKHREVSREFYTRVSERLRHKNRAINSWDYEHLILDRYPSVYKVKAVSHTDPNCMCRSKTTKETISEGGTEKVYDLVFTATGGPTPQTIALIKEAEEMLAKDTSAPVSVTGYGKTAAEVGLAQRHIDAVKKELMSSGVNAARIQTNISTGGTTGNVRLSIGTVGNMVVKLKKECCGPQVSPGHVLIIPIANLKNRNAVNVLQPKTSRRLMMDIESWLKKLVSPFVKIHVRNPDYEQVITAFRVKFHEGADKGFYLRKLNEELVRYLTPWAFDADADVKFGGKIYASNVINFIEERPYVDFITDFLMGVCRKECCPPSDDEKDTNFKVDNNKNAAMQIAELCGCDSVEAFLSQDVKHNGEVVVTASSPKALLVSVSQHIIVPYEEPEPLTRCEQRRLDKKVAVVPVPAPSPMPLPPATPVAENPQPSAPSPAAPAPAAQPGNTKPVVTGEVKPVTGGVKPADTKPVVAGEVKPATGSTKPVVTGEINPSAGTTKPLVTGEVKPVVTGEVKPVLTGGVKPVLTGGVKPLVTQPLKKEGIEEKATIVTKPAAGEKEKAVVEAKKQPVKAAKKASKKNK